ncbi:MAG: DUF1926 domain-containing protein [Acidobacteria bacterium]|nr:DUF1926 domain-containing protein [Acidobacteriota bacterium]
MSAKLFSPLSSLLSLLFLVSPALSADRPVFLYSATFDYRDLPKDLWADRLVQLKSMGFNAVQAVGEQGRDRLELLRLTRQLGLQVFEDPEGKAVPWFPAEPKGRLLAPADFTAVRRLHPVLISPFDAGWTAGDDIRARPSDPSNYLLATRELLAAGVKALNCVAVIEGRSLGEREAALSLTGEPRPQAAVMSRNGALLSGCGRLLATMRPADGAGVRLHKPFPLLRLTVLAAPGPRGPSFLSALNYSENRPATGPLEAVDPRTGKPVQLTGFNLPPRQALLMPLSLPLALPEVCPNCSAFAPDERLVWATAELVSATFENGVLGLEFVAPSEGELELELARRPQGPLITGARLRQFDWDDKTRRLHLHIPAGKAPDFHTRVGLGIQLPDTSVFLKAPRRFILGTTAQVTATFSSPELAARSRLLTPAGWRVQAEPAETEIDYRLEVPSDAVAGDTVRLAVQTDGQVAQYAAVSIAPPVSLRIEPEEALHPRRDARLAIRPHLATVLLPGHRSYRVFLQNHYDEIKTFELSAAGEGLEISPVRLELSVGANLEREVAFEVTAHQPGLYRWNLEVRDGNRKIETPLLLAALGGEESLAYELDLDRDGFPELILENAKVRAVFSPRHGGRSTEFLLKTHGVNAFTARGALQAGAPMEGRILGPGRIELRAADCVRRISLGTQDSFFEVEQSGGPAEWLISASADLEPTARFSILAPDAKLITERKAFSVQHRLRLPDGSPRRARFSIEPQ